MSKKKKKHEKIHIKRQLVFCRAYGDDGIIPDEDVYGIPSNCCISRTGGSICGGYIGEAKREDGSLVVKCSANMQYCYKKGMCGKHG